MFPIVRKAVSHDLLAIKAIADGNKSELGFIIKSALLVGIEKGWLFVIEQDNLLVGFIHYRHRQDTQTTIYEICVAQGYRGQGMGRLLIEAVIHEARMRGQTFILLKAIASLDANRFYEHLGFTCSGVERGKKQPLTIWRYLLGEPL